MKSSSYPLALFFAPAFVQTLCMFLLASTSLLAQAPELEWIKSDYPGVSKDIITDRSHNVYVTQVTPGLGFGSRDDILTIKYTPSGEEDWALRFDRSSQRDYVVAMAIDASSNLYVVGQSFIPGAGTEMFLIKYSSGVEEWVRIFDRSRMLGDIPVAIAIDETTQDIIVTGLSYITSTDSELVTLRYNSAGVLSTPILMTENRSAFGDIPTGLKVDPFGNVYVIGRSDYDENLTGFSPCDRMIVKYSPTGARLWYGTFNHGLDAGGSATRNSSRDLTFDENGDVYTIGGDDSYVTLLKYASGDGTQQVLVDQPAAATAPRLAVYNSSNIYIAWSDADRVNIYAYGATGTLLEGTTYINPSGLGVFISEMKLDRSGNLYFVITNSTLDTPFNAVMKYDAGLMQKWLRYSTLFSADWLEILSLHIDDLYNVYLAGTLLVDEFQSNGYAAKFTQSVPPATPPSLFREFERIDFSMYAREPDWCWSGIIIDWEIIPCLPPNDCEDPTMGASLINSMKVIWEEKFTISPFQATLPQRNTMNLLTLSKEVENAFLPLIVVDDNLVRNGFSDLTLSIYPVKNILNIKAETQKGAHLPFTITLLNKDGESIWQEDLLAPLEKEIKAFAEEPGVTFQISAARDEFKLNYFPNPFSEKLNIEIENETSLPGELTVYTLQGEKIIGQSVGATGRYVVNMNSEKPGLYILIVKVGNKQIKKLIELKY